MDKVSLPKHIFKNGYGSATLEKYEDSAGEYRVSVRHRLGGTVRLSEKEVPTLGELLREVEVFIAEENRQP